MIVHVTLRTSLVVAAALFGTQAVLAQTPAVPTFVDETASSGFTRKTTSSTAPVSVA